MENLSTFKPYRAAVIIGTTAGTILEIEQHATDFFALKKPPIQGVSFADSHTVSGSVAEAIGACGPAFTLIPIVYETRHQAVKSVCITTHGSSGNNAALLLTHT